jgi:ATP-dependent Lon protease
MAACRVHRRPVCPRIAGRARFLRVPPRLLPLFPLPVVLFPGVALPLQIFEPRYRQMLVDCLAADRVFGLLYRPEEEGDRTLVRGHVGCVAHIDESTTLPDGRSNIVVRGVERFALERFVESAHPYDVGNVSEYDDDDEPRDPLDELAAHVSDLFGRVGHAARTLGDDRDPLPPLPEDPALLSFSIASMIDLDGEARQRLLSSRSPTGRLRELDDLLSGAIGTLELRAAVHDRAKTNGHGPGPLY